MVTCGDTTRPCLTMVTALRLGECDLTGPVPSQLGYMTGVSVGGDVDPADEGLVFGPVDDRAIAARRDVTSAVSAETGDYGVPGRLGIFTTPVGDFERRLAVAVGHEVNLNKHPHGAALVHEIGR